MMQTKWIWGGALLLTIAACGGGGAGSQFKGEVSGIVTDANGDPVRGARVFADGKETFSNSAGSYVLERVSEGEHLIRAEISQNGIDFNGQNVVQVFRSERSKSLNIAIVRATLQARIHGTVRDRFGNRISGARVFAQGNALSSNVTITDSNGDFSLRALMSGINYGLTASARGYNSDLDSVNLTAGEDRTMNFVLGDGTNPAMPAPEDLTAVAWTTPWEISRAPNQKAALDAIKLMLDPRRARLKGRSTVGGNNIEVDLYWDEYVDNYTALIGFGIYRATTSGGASTAIDYLRDPNAYFYQDLDDDLLQDRNYYYEITALNTQYPDTFDSESDFSNRYGVRTLGDLELNSVLSSPLTFRWFAASGASSYVVYLFDEYPGIGVQSIWNTESSPTSSTSQVYNGPALSSGHRYYYVILGLANGNDSRTLSLLGDFVAN